MIIAALLLAGVVGNGAEQAVALLNHSSWTDIGPGRTYAQLEPGEIARLRKCATASMYFEHWDGRTFDEVFLTGISMRITFARADLARSRDTKVITLYRDANSAMPSETLWLTNNSTVLTQLIPPASPHVFVRCGTR
ncbi:MAG TPA: hypothetical protein VGG36_04115 [Rhizomicrobium sp.]